MKFVLAAIVALAALATVDSCRREPVKEIRMKRYQRPEKNIVYLEPKSILHPLKSRAMALESFTDTSLEEMFETSKDTAEHIITPNAFEEAVDTLIEEIDIDSSDQHCISHCEETASSIPSIGEGIAPGVCPSICKAVLAKLSEAKKQLSDAIEDEN